MKISNEDYKILCKVAKCLCDTEHEDYNYNQLDLYEMLNNVIQNIEE